MENFDYDLRSVQEVRNLARLGKIATEQIAEYTEEQIDRILQNMARVASENAVMLAKMAVEETGFGKVEDKTYKNHLASKLLYNAIKDMKTIVDILVSHNNKNINLFVDNILDDDIMFYHDSPGFHCFFFCIKCPANSFIIIPII